MLSTAALFGRQVAGQLNIRALSSDVGFLAMISRACTSALGRLRPCNPESPMMATRPKHAVSPRRSRQTARSCRP